MKKLKLLIAHNRYVHRGGEDICLDNEVTALREAGVDVTSFLVQSEGSTAAMAQAAIAPLGGGHQAQLEAQLRFLKPDILHVHNLYPLLSPRIFAAARSFGVRTVMTLHNYRPMCLNGLFLTPDHEVCERCAPGSYFPGIIRGCYRGSRLQSAYLATHLALAKRLGWQQAVNQFIAPSQFLCDKFIEYGFEANRILVQGHFLADVPVAEPEMPDRYVLYLGRLSPEKGVPWLLSHFSTVTPSLPLHLAGDGPLRREVESQTTSAIRYLGYLQGPEKSRALAKATALVMASDCYENFPLAVMEANQWGTPVLAPAIGGFTELITAGQNGRTFRPRDAESFQTELAAIQNDPAIRKRCQTLARSRFSKSEFLKARLSLYESLLAKRL